MKQAIAITLLICFIAPLGGTYIWLHQQKRQIKKQVKRHLIAGLSKNQLVLLKFTKADEQKKLRWEHAKEFEYNHQMYDVVTKQTIGDTTYYRCWWDNEETQLNKKLHTLLAKALGTNKANKDRQKRIIQFIENAFIQQHTLAIAKFNFLKQAHYTHNNYHLLGLKQKPQYPPPKI